MVSISSSKLIRERSVNFCKQIKDWTLENNKLETLKQIMEYLNKEYGMIPEKERIGKGTVYISKNVAKGIIEFLMNSNIINEKYIEKFTQETFSFGLDNESMIMKHFSLSFLGEYVLNYPDQFETLLPLIEKWIDSEEWDVRETVLQSALYALKKVPNKTFEIFEKWAKNENPNLRRAVSETSRPSASVKWLRDPTKNNKILELLTKLNKDPSIYVRKSVGNNLKDLTKYMPEKILTLMEQWIIEAKIKVHDELASEVGLSTDQKNLIWTIKHAMRWLKERNPEHHPRLEKILGKNYVLYFDEKKNRLAKLKG